MTVAYAIINPGLVLATGACDIERFKAALTHPFFAPTHSRLPFSLFSTDRPRNALIAAKHALKKALRERPSMR